MLFSWVSQMYNLFNVNVILELLKKYDNSDDTFKGKHWCNMSIVIIIEIYKTIVTMKK